jgi:hypothetical protein
MTGHQCWFILITPELVLATTIVGIAPIFVVLILYSIILRKALRKVGEMKSAAATSVVSTATNGRNLRYFVGSRADMSQMATAAEPMSNATRRCCWRCCTTADSSETHNATEGAVLTATTTTPKRQLPSRWKAIKVVMFTTGSFVFTWVSVFTPDLKPPHYFHYSSHL